MTNPEWFRYDLKKGTYVLTDKAPEKAKNSYKRFYSRLENSYEIKTKETE
jgi:hypothetical protein